MAFLIFDLFGKSIAFAWAIAAYDLERETTPHSCHGVFTDPILFFDPFLIFDPNQAQKIQLPKTCEKRFYKHIKVVLCKKMARKNSYYSKNESILKMDKNGHNAKAIVPAKYSNCVKK